MHNVGKPVSLGMMENYGKFKNIHTEYVEIPTNFKGKLFFTFCFNHIYTILTSS